MVTALKVVQALGTESAQWAADGSPQLARGAPTTGRAEPVGYGERPL